MASNENKDDSLGPSILLGLVGAVVVLVLIAGLVFGASKLIKKLEKKEEAVSTTVETGKISESAAKDEEKEEKKETSENENQNTEKTKENQESSNSSTIENAKEISKNIQNWVATDYKNGDISGNSYVVKYGDTLWEIAEARYGSGFMWTKIRDANSSKIGFLPNGSQALIFPNQVLTLPN